MSLAYYTHLVVKKRAIATGKNLRIKENLLSSCLFALIYTFLYKLLSIFAR